MTLTLILLVGSGDEMTEECRMQEKRSHRALMTTDCIGYLVAMLQDPLPLPRRAEEPNLNMNLNPNLNPNPLPKARRGRDDRETL